MKVINKSNDMNFKAIQLTSREACRIGRAMNQYKLSSNKEIKKQILDIFAPHMQNEVDLIAKTNKRLSVQDYTQKLYLKLFESIENIKDRRFSAGNLVSQLNEVKPEEDDFITMGHKSFDELTSEEDFITSKNEISLYEKMHKVFSQELRSVKPRNREIMLDYLEGYSIHDLGVKYNLSPVRIRELISEVGRSVRRINKHGERFRTVNPKTLIITNHCVNKGYVDEIMGSENF